MNAVIRINWILKAERSQAVLVVIPSKTQLKFEHKTKTSMAQGMSNVSRITAFDRDRCSEDSTVAGIDRDAIWAALESNSIPTLQALVDAGWDVNSSLGHAGNALTRAVCTDSEPLVAWLLAHGADPGFRGGAQSHSTLSMAAAHASTEVAGLLLQNGSEMKASGALETAAYEGRTEMIAYLLDQGAEIDEVHDNLWTTDFDRERGLGTALHAAAAQDEVEAVALLLEKGADPHSKDSNGKTPLQRAQKSQAEKVAELLKKKGITV